MHYTWIDYLLASWVIGAVLLWFTFEFLGALKAVVSFIERFSGGTPASAQEAAQRVTVVYEARHENGRGRRI